jgi:hypothetical protein
MAASAWANQPVDFEPLAIWKRAGVISRSPSAGDRGFPVLVSVQTDAMIGMKQPRPGGQVAFAQRVCHVTRNRV